MLYLLPLVIFMSCSEPTIEKTNLCDKALLHITNCYYRNSYDNKLLYIVDWDSSCNAQKADYILSLECIDPYFNRFSY